MRQHVVFVRRHRDKVWAVLQVGPLSQGQRGQEGCLIPLLTISLGQIPFRIVVFRPSPGVFNSKRQAIRSTVTNQLVFTSPA